MPKTNVYIDGFNLYYGAVKGTPYRWLDLSALCHHMLPNDDIRAIKYFTAKVNARPHDPQQPMRQQVYLRALRTLPDVTIVFGHFSTHSVPMTLTGSNPPQRVWVDKTEEKGSDVNLAAHLLHDAFKKLFDVAVVISNDSDLMEPIKIVRQDLGFPVGILNPHQHHSCALKPQASFMKRIRQADVAACQFASPIVDKNGSFHKPPTW
jgi:uncharacterized LabA/DUF88 family protein